MSRQLPVVPVVPDAIESCPGCTRREVLHGLAATAAALLAGCGNDRSTTEPGTGPDGGTVTPPDAPASGTTTCGANLCLDLADPANAALLAVDGARVIGSSAGALIVVRTSELEATTLSAVCTHSGCTVRFDATRDLIVCPCHGSRFDLAGEVVRSPALRPLRVFPTTLDLTANVIEITLA